MNFEFNLSVEELKKRTSKEYLVTKKFLTADSPEYVSLKDGDKQALKHLVKAAEIIEKINMQLDCKYNLDFKNFLEQEIQKGNKQAELTKILFDAQKGINAIDSLSNKINLAKGIQETPGKGVYPEDLSKEEFHSILIQMIKNGEINEVKNILTQRSVVIRNGKKLKGIDYIEYFKQDFFNIATELEKASEVSTNEEFNKYLKLQAKALKTADPMLDAYADKQWATLQDTPLEFTITRENYEDELTGTIFENKELTALLKEHSVSPIPKDFLGGRVGIVNKEGTKTLLRIKDFLPVLAKNMPFNNEYTQNTASEQDTKQTMVDVDMVYAAGDCGAYRGGITLAENLPNSDKLSLTIGGGLRNVYHRQIRFISDKEKLQKMLDEILDKNQHQYYLDEADHWFTIGHENLHSLGPKKGNERLGKYSNIIEENKADMGSLAFVDLLTELGMYTQEQRKQIIVTFITDNFLKSKPALSQAHRVRTVMQNKYMFDNGGYILTEDNKIFVNTDKVVPTAKKMLSEIIRIQIDGNIENAQKYIEKNFMWTDQMEIIAQKLQKVSKTLNGKLETKLADFLLEK
ncbi:hypothetical protein [Candidatus Ruminimicrobiellum ovillum]|uniref:hypothetical protein n=1 Tax=Candidatus Ruminimicrobiellum ovillum TaxID=1947927 RepID=UPI00355A3544